MRFVRWTLVIVCCIAVGAALALPGPVGRTIRDVSEAQLDALDTAQPAVNFMTEKSTSSWFASELTHRAVIDPRAIGAVARSVIGDTLFADQPAVTITTAVHHGPLALGALPYSWRALLPAWSRSRSTLSFDSGSERFDLPVTIDTTIGLLGGHRSALKAGAFDSGWKLAGARMAAESLDVSVATDRMGQVRALDTDARTLLVAVDGTDVSAKSLAVVARPGDTTRLQFAAAELRLESATAALAFDAIEAVFVAAATGLQLTATIAQTVPREASVDLVAALDGADTDLRRQLLGAYRRQGTLDPVDVLLRIAANNGSLTVERFEGSVDGNPYALSGQLVFAGSGATVLEVFARASGTAELTLHPDLVRLLSKSGLGVSWLGYLKRDGDVYRLAATLGNGELSLNGAVFPLQTDRSSGSN